MDKKKKLKENIKKFCLEDPDVMKDFPWNLLSPSRRMHTASQPSKKSKVQPTPAYTAAENLHRPKTVISQQELDDMGLAALDSAEKPGGWRITFLGTVAAVAIALAGTGWASAIVLHRQLQSEHERYLMASTRADLLAANADPGYKTISSAENSSIYESYSQKDQAAQNTLTPVSLAIQRLMDIQQAASAYMIQGVQTGLNKAAQVRLEKEQSISMQGQILTVLNMNGTREYLIADDDGNQVMAYLDEDPILAQGEWVYIEGIPRGSVGYVDENGDYSVVDEIQVQHCEVQF